jgi:zinc transporter, ZIP family
MINTSNMLIFSLIPVIGIIIGGFIGSFTQLKPSITSATQHLAAGIVFAAVAIDLLPLILKDISVLNMSAGFLTGVASMMCLKWFSNRIAERDNAKSRFPTALALTIGIDVFIDGLLIGVAFLAGQSVGISISIALAIEILFLSLSMSVTLNTRGIARRINLYMSMALAATIILGVFIGDTVLGYLPSIWTKEILAFGVAALLYLVTEELLVEAHEEKETPFITVFFFLGFLFVLIFKA